MHLYKLHKSICDKIRVEGIRKNFSESMLGILPVSDNEKNGKLRRTKLRHHLPANAARRKLTVDNAAFAARNRNHFKFAFALADSLKDSRSFRAYRRCKRCVLYIAARKNFPVEVRRAAPTV